MGSVMGNLIRGWTTFEVVRYYSQVLDAVERAWLDSTRFYHCVSSPSYISEVALFGGIATILHQALSSP